MSPLREAAPTALPGPARALILQTLGRPRSFSPNNALLTLARHLDPKRYAVDVAVPREGLLSEALREAGVAVHTIPGLRTYRRRDAAWRFPLVAWRLGRLARRLRPDLIMANHAELAPFAGAAARRIGIPWICFLRQAARKGAYYRKYRVQRATAVGGVSESALEDYRAFLASLGLRAQPMLAVRSAVDPPGAGAEGREDCERRQGDGGRSRMRAAAGWGDAHRVVGAVGLREVKRPDRILEIFARLASGIPEARCLLVGEAPEGMRLRLDSLARSLGIANRIHFAGQQPEPGPWYAAMDVYVHAAESEGLGKTILEAMAHRLPVVAFPVGGVRESVQDGVTGFLPSAGDVEEFARRVERLLRDGALARRMGEAGRERVERHFSPRNMAERMMDLFDLALEESRRSGAAPVGVRAGEARRGEKPGAAAPAAGGAAEPGSAASREAARGGAARGGGGRWD
jgi:glycosyltransferase involved in cell wall biosynthesis